MNWEIKHKAIHDMIDLLERELALMSQDADGDNVFLASAALARCLRYLQAVDVLTHETLGDTAGGDLRIIYETWIFGHTLLFADVDGLKDLWAQSRGSTGKVTNPLLGKELAYPDNAPEATNDHGVLRRAQALRKKLKQVDPGNAGFPEQCYDLIYRTESLLSTHANLPSVLKFASSDGARITLIPSKPDHWRLELAGTIVVFFAESIMDARRTPNAELSSVASILATDPVIGSSADDT